MSAASVTRASVVITVLLCICTLPVRGYPANAFFYLVRSWSPTFCLYDYSADQGACGNATNRFTIHGLWLTCSNGGWPDERDCSNSPYDPSAISDLVPALNEQWPSYGDKGNDAFWNHEWTCHGVCAGVEDTQLTAEPAFFQQVLQLDSAKTLNVLTGQLELDTDMPTDDFVSMAAQQLGATPVVTCYYRNGKAYLSSVMSCLAGDLSLEDCQPTQESCDTETLTVPSLSSNRLKAARGHRATSEMPQRSLLRSDPEGCAIPTPRCNLPGMA